MFVLECGPGHPDSPDLSAYPLLVWTPETGVQTEDGKVRLDQLDPEVSRSVHGIAEAYGTTIGHATDVVMYLYNERSR